MPVLDLLVRKSSLADARLRTREAAPLASGEIRVGIDHVALTANNITYATFGDSMGYWQFFPTGEDDWGCIPVWGFARVLQSLHPGVAVGERIYGYFPLASEHVLTPQRLHVERFSEGSAHRAELPAVYNQYFRTASDPLYSARTEELQALLRPLYITSWLIDDYLGDNDFFGARAAGRPTVLLSSASSKTAYGTAFQLAARGDVEVVGLTSEANRAFCESLGCYTRVLDYGALDTLAADLPCVYVDFAGNGALRSAIHNRFAQLRCSLVIGNTHLDQRAPEGSAKALPGPRPTFFFAPAQIKKRTGEWGAEAFAQRLTHAWQQFLQHVAAPERPWLRVARHHGPEAAMAVYRELLSGRTDPRVGHILSLAAPSAAT